MTRAQSMDVINDATTLQSRIDAALAAPIMEWDHSPEIQWQPGDPLYNRFDKTYRRRVFELVGVTLHRTGEWDDERNRPIYEVEDSHDDTMDGYSVWVDCEDCQVGVDKNENSCWNCGKVLWLTPKKTQGDYYESARQEPCVIDFRGVEISQSNLEWFTDFFFNNPLADYVRFRPVETVNFMADYDPRSEPMSVGTQTHTYSRRDVDEMRVMFEEQSRQIPNHWGVVLDGEGELDMRSWLRSEMLRMLNDELGMATYQALWGDGSPTMFRPNSSRVVGHQHYEWTPPEEGFLRGYAETDVLATNWMYLNLNDGPIEPYTPQLDIYDDSLYVRSTEIRFDEPEEGVLASLRRAIDWEPPRFQTVWFSHPRQYGRSEYEYLRNQFNLYMAEREQPAPLPEVPRITLHASNPDLYRPGYERYFESENNNGHGPQPARPHPQGHSRRSG